MGVQSPASKSGVSVPLPEDPAQTEPRQPPVRYTSQAATATASMAGEGTAAGAGSSCAETGSAWSALRSAPESGSSQSLPGLRDPEDLKPRQLLTRPGHSPAAAGSGPLAGRGPAAPAAAAFDSSAGSVLAGGAQGAQTGCTWGARSESGTSMPGLENPQEVEQAAASSSTGWVGLCQASSSSVAGLGNTNSPPGRAGSNSHSGQAGSSTGPGWAACKPHSSQAGTSSDSNQGSSSTASGGSSRASGGVYTSQAAEEQLCGKPTAARAQHAGLSMAPDAAAALSELLQMVGGQAPTEDLRQHLAKVQAANVTAARASVRTPPGAAAAGYHHPEVLQRAAANRESARDCLARAKRMGLGQQMLPQDVVVSIVSPNPLHDNTRARPCLCSPCAPGPSHAGSARQAVSPVSVRTAP